KGQVIAASLLLLALIGGILGTSIGLVRADHEREKAEGLADNNAKLAALERDAKNKATELATANAQLADDESKAKNKATELASTNAQLVDDERKARNKLEYQLGISDFLLAHAAYHKSDVKLAGERLQKVPEKQRGWEWHYLKQQMHGGLFTLRG